MGETELNNGIVIASTDKFEFIEEVRGVKPGIVFEIDSVEDGISTKPVEASPMFGLQFSVSEFTQYVRDGAIELKRD